MTWLNESVSPRHRWDRNTQYLAESDSNAKKKKSFKWVSEECDAGMTTATVKTVWSPKERVYHSVVTVTPRWGIARNIITFGARIWVKRKKKRPLFKKIQRSTSRQVERFMLSRPWAPLVGVYLEFIRELKLSVRMRGATVKQQMCVRSSLMREKQERTIHSVSVADICIQDRLYGPS